MKDNDKKTDLVSGEEEINAVIETVEENPAVDEVESPEEEPGVLVLEESEDTENTDGVIDAVSEVYVSLSEGADISSLTEIIKDE